MDEIGKIEPLDAGHDLSAFDCGEAALNDWLFKHALKNQGRNNTRTFVLPTLESCGRKVIGFYALVVATLAPEDAFQSLREGASPKNLIPAILIARLGTTLAYGRRGLGRALLQDALRRSLGISRDVGVRAVITHAKAGSESFYIHNAGFQPSPTDPLHLILPIKTLADSLKIQVRSDL